MGAAKGDYTDTEVKWEAGSSWMEESASVGSMRPMGLFYVGIVQVWVGCAYARTGRICYRAMWEERQSEMCDSKRRRLTTFPGLRFDRLQVEVSVVQQLKHRRRTLSLNFVAASSVYITVIFVCPGKGYDTG